MMWNFLRWLDCGVQVTRGSQIDFSSFCKLETDETLMNGLSTVHSTAVFLHKVRCMYLWARAVEFGGTFWFRQEGTNAVKWPWTAIYETVDSFQQQKYVNNNNLQVFKEDVITFSLWGPPLKVTLAEKWRCGFECHAKKTDCRTCNDRFCWERA